MDLPHFVRGAVLRPNRPRLSGTGCSAHPALIGDGG